MNKQGKATLKTKTYDNGQDLWRFYTSQAPSKIQQAVVRCGGLLSCSL
jgi:hypothetical protein